MPGRLHVLVVDDELLARQRLEDLLADLPEVDEVRTASSGTEAVEAIRDGEPDLVFLDMQMPGLGGLDVVRRVGPEAMPMTIFVTAHDHYAVEAFEVAALDYLLKPFDDDRFRQAFGRAVKQLELRQVGDAATRLVDLLEGRARGEEDRHTTAVPRGRSGLGSAGRIPVESGGTVHLLDPAEVSHVTAAGPYSELHTPERSYLVRETMQTLEDQLSERGFFRVHRSSLVRLDRVKAVDRRAGGDYWVRLRNGVELSVSRARIRELERRLGVER